MLVQEIQEEHKMHLEKARAELKAPKGIPAKPGQPLVQARVPPPKVRAFPCPTRMALR